MSAPPLRAIGELVEPVSSWTPERDGPDGVFTYIDLSAVDQDAKAIAGAREVVCSEAPSRARQLVRAGDVLVSTVRPNLNGVAHVPPEFDGATASTGFCVLRPRATQLDGQYLYQWVKSPHFVKDMVRKATGASYPAVSDRIVCESKIPLPPLPEQRRIAAILDKADALRAKRRAAIAQLDTLTQSIFLDMFGDISRNDRHWPQRKLGELLKIRRGGSPRPIEKYLGGDINWIKIGDGVGESDMYIDRSADKITREGLNKTVFLKVGSLILANSGVSLGFARILRIDGCIHDGWLSLEEVPEDVLNKMFLLKALNSLTEHFRRIAPSGTQPNLNTELVKAFAMVMPPLALQDQFTKCVAAIERLKSMERRSVAEVDAAFSSIQHRVFQGEL